jgi:hypothetical protein
MLIVRESWTMRDAKKDRRQSMLHLWFDADKCRLEDLHEPWTDRNGKDSPRNTENACRGCYSDTTIVWHSDRPVSSGKMAVIVTDIGLSETPQYQVPNPRLFGLGASNLHNCDWPEIDAYVGNKARTDESVARETYHDEECWKVKYRLPSAPQEMSWALRFWVSPKQGGSIVRIEYQGKYKDNEFISTVACENQKAADTGLWFPRRLVWETGKVGTEPLTHEEAQITLVSLNKPIDPAVFSFKAIRSITPGMFVRRDSKEPDPNFFNDQIVTIRGGREVHHASAVWNGERLVANEEFEKPRNPLRAAERPTAEDLLAAFEKSVEKLARVRIEFNGTTADTKLPNGGSRTTEGQMVIFRDGPRCKVDQVLRTTNLENGNRSESRSRCQTLVGDEIITVVAPMRGEELGTPTVSAARGENVMTQSWQTLGYCMIVFGRIPGDGGHALWTIMRESGSLELLPKTEIVDGVETHILTSRGKYGEHKLWLDAASGGLPRRIEVHKHPGNLLGDEQLGARPAPNAEKPADPRGRIRVSERRGRREFSTRIGKMKIENSDGVFVITGFEQESSTTYTDGKESNAKKEHTFRVMLVPDELPEDTFRFQIAIPNGTRVLVTENDLRVDGRFEWVDGKIQQR